MEGIRSMRLSEHAPVDSIDPDEGVTSLQPKVHTYFLCLISGCILWLCFIFFKKSETTPLFFKPGGDFLASNNTRVLLEQTQREKMKQLL